MSDVSRVIVWFAVRMDGFICHTGIATPETNNLLAYTLVFLVLGVPVGLSVSYPSLSICGH